MKRIHAIDLSGFTAKTIRPFSITRNDWGVSPDLNETDSWFNKLAAEDLAERDANASREAFDTFKELVLRYPDSRFAPEARRRMHGLVLAQAEHELKTAQYY